MDDADVVATLRLNEIFMPSASRERKQMFARQGVEFGHTAAELKFVHYTSADAALSILRTKRMWMRNARCMTDYREVQHGFELLRSYFTEDRTKAFFAVVDAVAPGSAKTAFDYFNGWWGHRHLAMNIFIASLSEHANSENEFGRLSMWRAFGASSALRVALVLKIAANSKASSALSLLFSPVGYLKEEEVHREIAEVVGNIAREAEFLRTAGSDTVIRYLFYMLFASVTCLKHEAFREEREWRAVYNDDLYPSPLMEKSIEVIAGVPQHVFKIPLDKNASADLATLDLSQLVERVIIGPSSYPWPLYQAFVDVLQQAKVPNAAERVWVSGIPLR